MQLWLPSKACCILNYPHNVIDGFAYSNSVIKFTEVAFRAPRSRTISALHKPCIFPRHLQRPPSELKVAVSMVAQFIREDAHNGVLCPLDRTTQHTYLWKTFSNTWTMSNMQRLVGLIHQRMIKSHQTGIEEVVHWHTLTDQQTEQPKTLLRETSF